MVKRILFILAVLSTSGVWVLGQVFEPVKPAMVLKKQEGAILSVAYSPDGKLLATGSNDKTCQLWSLPDGKPLNSILGYVTGVQSVLFTPDNQYLCMAVDKFIKVYKPTGENIYSYKYSATQLYSIAYNAKSNLLTAGNYENVPKVMDFKTGKIIQQFSGHSKNMLAVAFSTDGKYLASGSLDQTVKVWDLMMNKLFCSFDGHFGNIYSLVFSTDSKRVISASEDKTIRVWDLTTQSWEKTLTGHEAAVSQIAISPDGNYILSASADASVKLWDINLGECIYTFDSFKDIVYCLAFAPDGKSFAAGSKDHSVFIFSLTPGLLVEHFFSKEVINEAESSGLFVPKKEGESKTEYKSRLNKAEEFRIALIEKYYQKYCSEVRGKSTKPIQ